MTSEEVRAIVLSEIGGQWDRSNLHDVDLRQCLLPDPRKKTYRDSFHGDRPIDLWLVLEEDPAQHEGYEIVFDDARGEFGLAIGGHEAPVFLGYHGSFVDTLEGM